MKTSLKILAAVLMTALPATAQDVPGVTEDSIKIGVMGPFSGNASSYSKALVGMMAYYDKVNADGGVHGRKLVAIPEDTACDPSKGLAAAKKSPTAIMAKVTRQGGGSAIPVRPRLLARLVRAAVGAAGGVPVTIKSTS